jgi:outer membrane protein
MKMTRHATTLIAALLLSTMSPSVFAQVRVAVVDMQRALNETSDGRRAKAQLKRLFKRRQQALDAKQNELKRMEEYQKAFVELQTTYVEYQRELATKEAQLTKGILARMQNILQRIGRADGYTLIVERNEGGVVWAPSNIDITDDLIQRYNAGEGRGGGGRSKRR